MNSFRLWYRKPTLSDLKANGKKGHCLYCRRTLKGRQRVMCESKVCQAEHKTHYMRDYRQDVFSTPHTPNKEGNTMALNDEQQKAIEATLAEKEKALKELQDSIKQSKANDTEVERQTKLKSEKPDNTKLDPDVVKEIAEMKIEIAALKKKNGSASGSIGMLNFFDGEKK